MVKPLTTAAIDRGRLRTFPEVLGDWATKAPDRRAYLYLSEGEREEASLTFSELRNAAFAAANHLAAHARPGDRVLLFYPSGLDFIVAFLGCLCAGVIAVPVSVPNRKRGLEILAGVASDSGAQCILSVGSLLSRYEEEFAADASLSRLPRIDTSGWCTADSAAAASSLHHDLQAPALLQYTSGSTGVPRGVIVTHANLADNQAQQAVCAKTDEHTRIVSWLPMFHDMGLGTVLQALWVGAECVLMSPSAFLQKPVRWLRAIAKYRATGSGGPDFAFDLCSRSINAEECKGLDLSSWIYAYNGSEPVRAATLARFHQVFAPYGFRWEAFHALYGLAEATLFVSGEGLDKGPSVQRFSRHSLEKRLARPDASESSQALVACGRNWLDGRIAIVDPESLVECAIGHIGEIWVAGPSVAAGYWGKETETRETFQAHTASGQGPFLRTGDLGFLHDNDLFITGRSKDLIIVRGRNHYPQDIEDTVSNCHPALEPQRCAAFSVDSEDGESLVVAQEVKRSALRSIDPEDVFRSIRKSVADRHGLYAAAIVLLRPLALPRTTSGKVRRKACHEAFLNHALPEVASSGIVGATLDPPARASVPPSSASATAARLAEWLRQYSRSPVGADIARRNLPPDAMTEFARQGLLGMQIGAQHGGLALKHGEAVRVLEQLGGVDLGASLFLGLNNYLGVWPLLRHGQLRLQQDVLPELATGRQLAGFALTEPGAYASAEDWGSRAEAVNGSGWRLYGKKFVTGGASESGFLNVFVRHKDRPGVSGFVVPRNAKGVAPASTVTEDGMVRETLSLDGVFVEPRQVLGQLGQGEQVAFDAIRHSHLAIGASCLGGMKRCSQLIFQHATQRQIGEAGLVAHPVTMTRLGRITAEVTALECLVRLLAELADEDRVAASEAFTVCKLVGPEMLWQAVDDLVQLLGRRGLVETLQIRKLADDARILRGLEGPMEASAAVLGAGLLDAELDGLRKLESEVFSELGLEPLVTQAVGTLREAKLLTAGGPPASQHWLHARAGEIASWLVLFGAVERKRRAASTADLERTAAWVRSNLENALSVSRAGPPPEVRLGAGDALAAYDRSVGGLEGELGHDSGPRIRGDLHGRQLRGWAISWLAERLRVDDSRIDPHRSFADHGVDSLAAVEFAKALADRVGITLDETLLWNFPTIDSLLTYLEKPQQSAGPAPAAAPAANVSEPPRQSPASAIDDELERLERELKKRS